MAKSAKVNGQSAIERAQGRALAAGLPIVGRGWRVADGALAWAVPSQSAPGKFHYVVLVGARLECDCKGARDFALTCIHMGVVYNELASEARAFAAQQATQRQQAQATRDAQRASAPLYRDNRPFSLFKA